MRVGVLRDGEPVAEAVREQRRLAVAVVDRLLAGARIQVTGSLPVGL